MAGFNIMSEAARESIGYLGGSLLALAMLPQILRIWVTKSATDVSLLWTLLYLGGITFTLAYLVLLGHLAGWLPSAFEVLLGVITVVSKLLFDHTEWGTRQKQKMQQQHIWQFQQQVSQLHMHSAVQQDDGEVTMHELKAAAAVIADQCSYESMWSGSITAACGTVGNAAVAAAAACNQLAMSADSQSFNLAAATTISAEKAQGAAAAAAAVARDMSLLSSADIHLEPIKTGSSRGINSRQLKWSLPSQSKLQVATSHLSDADLDSSNLYRSSSTTSPRLQQQQQQHQTIAAAVGIPVQLASGAASQPESLLLPTTVQICPCCGALRLFEQAPYLQHNMQQIPSRTAAAAAAAAAIEPLHKSTSGDASAMLKHSLAGVDEQQSAHRLELR